MHAIAPNWHRVRELHPDAELHAYYGWDNIENAMDNSDGFVDPKVRRLYDRFRDLKQEEGIVWHGRTGQRALYGDLLTASVWPYWSDFKETSCIACQEAQCAGLFPITRPVWAVGDNVRYGVFYHGSAWSEGYSLSSAIAWTATALGDRAYQEALRPAMMVNSRFRFDWERVVDQYELWARGIEFKTNINDDHGLPLPWHAYQILESHGDILNVGCHTDSAMFKENHGDRCTNLDTAHEDPNMPGVELPVDVIGDGRNLDFPNDRFDTVVLGEVLKHMKEKDAKKTLKEARRVAKDRVVVTVPADTRTRDEQDAVRRSLGWTEPTKNYVGGISGYHIKQWDWTDILKTAGKGAHALGTPRVVRNPYGKGWGLVINGS
jgi:hypothetical protein